MVCGKGKLYLGDSNVDSVVMLLVLLRFDMTTSKQNIKKHAYILCDLQKSGYFQPGEIQNP